MTGQDQVSQNQLEIKNQTMSRREERRLRLIAKENKQFRVLVLFIAALGVLLRVIWINFYIKNNILSPDYSVGYDGLAQEIAAGNFDFLFINNSGSVLPPFFSFFLAFEDTLHLYSPTGQATSMAVLFAIAIVVSAYLVKYLYNFRAGIICATLVAFLPNSWLYSSHLISENLVVIFVPCVIYMAYKCYEYPSDRNLIFLGMLVAISILDRGEEILLIPVLLIPLILRIKFPSFKVMFDKAVVLLGATILVLSLYIIPCLIKYRMFEYLGTPTGQALTDSNCNSTYYTRGIGQVDTFCFAQDNLLLTKTFQHYENHVWDLSQDDYALRSFAFNYIGQNLHQFVFYVLPIRFLRNWHLITPNEQLNADLSEVATGWPGVAGLFFYIFDYSFIILLISCVLYLRKSKKPILPLIAYPITISLVSVLDAAYERYRAALEASLIISAAIGLEFILQNRSDMLNKAREVFAALKGEKSLYSTKTVRIIAGIVLLMVILTVYMNLYVVSLPH
jgi:hypothetical protein